MDESRRLTRNAARCLACGDTVESKHRHDSRQCSCGALFVDGGLEYTRRGFGSAGYEELSEYVPTDPQPARLSGI